MKKKSETITKEEAKQFMNNEMNYLLYSKADEWSMYRSVNKNEIYFIAECEKSDDEYILDTYDLPKFVEEQSILSGTQEEQILKDMTPPAFIALQRKRKIKNITDEI